MQTDIAEFDVSKLKEELTRGSALFLEVLKSEGWVDSHEKLGVKVQKKSLPDSAVDVIKVCASCP